MTLAAEKSKFNRQIIQYVKITLDRCSLTWQTAPCVAAGSSPCEYSYPTCQDKANYTKTTRDYKFTQGKAPIDFDQNNTFAFPFLLSTSGRTTEIDPENSSQIRASIRIEFEDAPAIALNRDKGAGKFNTPGSDASFFRLLFRQNRNFRRRPINIYEGTPDFTEAQFEKVFSGVIEDVSFEEGKCIVIAKDVLKKLDKKIPNIISDSNVLEDAPLTAAATTISVTDASEFSAPSGSFYRYAEIGGANDTKERIRYSGVNTGNNTLTGVTRGWGGTTAKEWYQYTAIKEVVDYTGSAGLGTNPVDIMLDLIENYGEIDASSVDEDSFTDERDEWFDGVLFAASSQSVVRKSIEIERLLSELKEDTGKSVIWQNEGGLIEFRPNRPASPTESLSTLYDDDIVQSSMRVELNTEEQKTRSSCFHNRIAGTDEGSTKPDDYDNAQMLIDDGIENANNYAEVVGENIRFSRWVTAQGDAQSYNGRLLRQYAEPPRKVNFELDIKNDTLAVGDLFNLETRDILDDAGEIQSRTFQILRKIPRGEKTEILAIDTQFTDNRGCFIGPDTLLAYDSEDATDKARYGFMADDSNNPATLGAAQDSAKVIL